MVHSVNYKQVCSNSVLLCDYPMCNGFIFTKSLKLTAEISRIVKLPPVILHASHFRRIVKCLISEVHRIQPPYPCKWRLINCATWIPCNLSFRYNLFHEKKKTPSDAVTPQRQGQFTPKMKANAIPRLLSSLVWIDQYNECNRMITFIEFIWNDSFIMSYSDQIWFNC